MTQESISAPIVAIFSGVGRVGTTVLLYHLAWMFEQLGVRVVAADLDPQAQLTETFFDEEEVRSFWRGNRPSAAALEAVGAMTQGTQGVRAVPELNLHSVSNGLHLLAGDSSFAKLEDVCYRGGSASLQALTAAFRGALQRSAVDTEADIVLVDLGPGLGPLNRSALAAVDWVVMPLSPTLFSLQGLTHLGPALRDWRKKWKQCLSGGSSLDLDLPAGEMRPAGYVVLQHSIRLDRPTRAYDRWIELIPKTYHRDVLGEAEATDWTVQTDPYALALLKHYRTLMALAQEARKPIFSLTAADGASGAHYTAARGAGEDFEALARKIAKRINLPIP